MRLLWLLSAALLLTGEVASPQHTPPETRTLAHFEVHNTPRLLAIARLGALTRTSILVEADTLPYLQAPISLTADNATVFSLSSGILRGAEPYSVRQAGNRLVLFSTRNRSRLLTLLLGPVSFTGNELSSLILLLGYHVSRATGCDPQGYAYAGGAFDLQIPEIHLSSATLEQVVTQVAEAPLPSMWIIAPDPTPLGCNTDPLAHWQIGLYGFGSGFTGCDVPFRGSIGPGFVPLPKDTASPDASCAYPHLPNPLPAPAP